MKGFMKLVGALLVVALVVFVGLYVAMSIPKKVNVTWSEKDLVSYQKKARAEIKVPGVPDTKAASLEDLLTGNYKSTGAVKVDEVVTSAEATAMANSVMRGQGIVSDVRLGFRPDGSMEASGVIGPNIAEITRLIPEAKAYQSYIQMAAGKPVYWRYTVTRVNDKKFDGRTLELYIGQVPVPLDTAGPGLVRAGSAINNLVARIDGFSCQALKIDEKGFHFKGSVPENLEYVQKNNPLIK